MSIIRLEYGSQVAGGVPFCAIEFQSKGDAITDIAEDLAAEQKARSTYDNLLRLCRDDPDVYEPLKFLREREVVHFQRFEKLCRLYRASWILRTSMHITRNLKNNK